MAYLQGISSTINIAMNKINLLLADGPRYEVVRLLSGMEKDIINNIVIYFDGDKTKACELLGISRNDLEDRLKIYSSGTIGHM